MNSGRFGRPRTGRSQQNIDRVQQLLIDNPRGGGVSGRRNGLGLPQATFSRIISKDLKWHPYKMRMHHALKPGDFNGRVHFCEWLLEKCRDRRFLANFIIGDEAAFTMNGRSEFPKCSAVCTSRRTSGC